jgi:hypothetical protein
MLATLLIWLSGAVAVLALLDLFLSKTQKAWLSNAVIKAWSILDEAKEWSFTDWLKMPKLNGGSHGHCDATAILIAYRLGAGGRVNQRTAQQAYSPCALLNSTSAS